MGSETTPVERLMTSDVITASPGTSVQEAADKLLEEEIGSLLVVDDDSSLLGVLTSTDLVAIVSAGEVDPDATVEEYMTDTPVTIEPTVTVDQAAVRMMTNGIQHLPVEDESGLVGMLSATDLTSYLTYTDSSGAE